MEHITLSHVAKHLGANNILLDSQHGFRDKLSSVTQLISSCHDLATTIHSQGQIDVVFLDFSKAFDEVPIVDSQWNCLTMALMDQPWHG